jgi:hypothetical protein
MWHAIPVLETASSPSALGPKVDARQGRQFLLTVPSHMVTNSEIAALYQILKSDQNGAADAFYGQLLVDLVRRAYERRQAFYKHGEGTCLDVAERIEGVIKINEHMYRFIGQSESATSSWKTWASFSEQTAPKGGAVWFADARGIGI